VRTRGYVAFSYADLSEVVGIRKASIHHYFPGKEDLGVAIVAAYRDRISSELADILSRHRQRLKRIEAYIQLYRDALEAGLGCLCGVLASEMAILPPNVAKAVQAFFRENLVWLERVLAEGPIRSGFHPERQAQMVLATLQGALVASRALEDRGSFESAVTGLLENLRAWS